ncbi:glucose-1-phosphate adenylyltransferase [mine drainage metagenome]|uniref:Glucose-1-phosphate adenylyltransferase n=1 Tax=mine drainage metagenome TaxID=410659 RepID=T1CEA5_9ZZZZ
MILPSVRIGSGCVVRDAIIDEGSEVPNGMTIGVDREADAKRFLVTDNGVVLVTGEMLRRLAP